MQVRVIKYNVYKNFSKIPLVRDQSVRQQIQSKYKFLTLEWWAEAADLDGVWVPNLWIYSSAGWY